MFDIEHKAARAARRAGLLSGGALLCTVGAAFLTVALWLALQPILGTAETALIIGAGYTGLGLVFVGLSLRQTPPPTPSAPVAQTPTSAAHPPLVEAFLYGLKAGAQSKAARA